MPRAYRKREIQPIETRFWKYVDKRGPADCWPWTGHRSTDGYGRIKVDGNMEQASRVAWELTFGPIPTGKQILHHCDVPACCNPAHLFLGTQADNMADMIRKGRENFSGLRCVGSTNGAAQLDERLVREMRRLYATGKYTQRKLAQMFYISNQVVSSIVNRKLWQHVK